MDALFLFFLKCHRGILFIVTYRAELALLGAVNEAMAEKIALDIVGLGAEVIAQCLKRVELLVAKQHVDARHQYGRVFR